MNVRPRLPVRSVLLAVVLAVMTLGVAGQSYDNWTSLMTKLTAGYNRNIRPAHDWNSTSRVLLMIYLDSIIDVNEKKGTLSTLVTLGIFWFDPFLRWDSATYGGIEALLLRQREIWLPDLILMNSAQSQTKLGYNDLPVRIESDGLVRWTPSGVFETACDMDITYYPFDTQVCNIIIGTSNSNKKEISVRLFESHPIDLSEYSVNGLWTLASVSTENLTNYDYPSSIQDLSVTRIQFKFQLQRRRGYYVMNIILPILFLSLISSVTFALPCESGEKISLAITILLAYAVYLTIVTDSMPATSEQVSVVMVYLVIQLALTAASVVLNVVILHFHHRHPSRPIRGFFAAFILALRKPLRLGPPTDQHDMDHDDASNGNEQQQKNLDGENESGLDARVSDGGVSGVFSVAVAPAPESRVPRWVGRKGRRRVSGQCVAETLGMLLLIIFTSVSLGLTIVCMAVLSVGGDKQFAATALG